MSDSNKRGVMKFYKSAGAAQFTLLPAKFNEKGFLDREGAVLLQVAKGNGDKNNPTYDWTKKITFAIAFQDIANMLDVVNPKARRIYHEHDNTSKTLEIQEGEGNFAGTYKLMVAQGAGADRIQVMVPLTNGEHAALMRVLVAVLPTLVGFDNA